MNDNLTIPPDGGKLRPWEAIGMSRASWYRHGKPAKKPERFTVRDLAESLNISERTVQRHEARRWRDFWRLRDEAMRKDGFNGPWEPDAIGSWLDRHSEFNKLIGDWIFNEYLTKLYRTAKRYPKGYDPNKKPCACPAPLPPAPGFQEWACWTGSKRRFHLAG
jgi:hypothetical protein